MNTCHSQFNFEASILHAPLFMTPHTNYFLFAHTVFVIKNNPPIHINNVKIFANKSVTHPPFAKSDKIYLKEMESKLEI